MGQASEDSPPNRGCPVQGFPGRSVKDALYSTKLPSLRPSQGLPRPFSEGCPVHGFPGRSIKDALYRASQSSTQPGSSKAVQSRMPCTGLPRTFSQGCPIQSFPGFDPAKIFQGRSGVRHCTAYQHRSGVFVALTCWTNKTTSSAGGIAPHITYHDCCLPFFIALFIIPLRSLQWRTSTACRGVFHRGGICLMLK